MKYRCLSSENYVDTSYCLSSITKNDLLFIKKWRNDQILYLRQNKPLTDTDQENYYEDTIKKMYQESYPNSLLFRVLYEDDFIGYGGLVHIDWSSKSGEASFLNETKREKNENFFKKDFLGFYKILLHIAFFELNFNKLTTETYEFRVLPIELLEKIGFKLEKRMKKHVYKNGKHFDSLIHVLLREDYLKT